LAQAAKEAKLIPKFGAALSAAIEKLNNNQPALEKMAKEELAKANLPKS
jgi:flagellar hook-basal body complex protein FliE